jgi:hypothetical protein
MTIADEVDSQLCQAMQTFTTEPAPTILAAPPIIGRSGHFGDGAA